MTWGEQFISRAVLLVARIIARGMGDERLEAELRALSNAIGAKTTRERGAAS